MIKKILDAGQIEDFFEKFRNSGKTIVTTNGSFDILHSAHVNLLEKAKSHGDVLVVLLNSDASIKRNKGEKRPIVSQNDRAKMLSSLECVDYVVIFNEDTPLEFLSRIKPKKHVKGGSYDESRMREEKDLVSSWGGEYITFPLEDGFSTTKIIEKILNVYVKS